MTAIVSVFDAIAHLNPCSGSIVSVRSGSDLRNVVHSSDTPMRLLLITNNTSEARDFSFLAMGTLSEVDWTICDRLLWKPAAQGAGLQDVAAELISYIDSYIEQVRANRKLTSQSHIVGARFVPGTAAWPPESGVLYFAVDVFLEIHEIVS